MRQDARNLLERLSRKDFKYQQFADPYADMELWPIFQALLTDERVTGTDTRELRGAEVQIRPRDDRQEKPVEAARPRAPLFERYNQRAAAQPPRGGDVVNMRSFLDRLSDKN